MGISYCRIPLLVLLLLLLVSVITVRSALPTKCGIRQLNVMGLIMNGNGAFRGQYPWHVAIFKYRRVESSYICGGSIISPFFVVTGANCIVGSGIPDLWKHPELFYFRAGAHNIKNETDGYNYNVSEIIVHPKFNQETYNNDIALLRSIGDISFDDPSKVLPICLPPLKTDKAATIQELSEMKGFVAGWGTTENQRMSPILQTLSVSALSMDVCREMVPEDIHKILDLDVMFCGRGEKKNSNVCTGDSGGGLVYFKNKVGYLRGIVSFAPRYLLPDGMFGCDPNGAVGYTDVARYVDWMTIINESSLCKTYRAEQQRSFHCNQVLHMGKWL